MSSLKFMKFVFFLFVFAYSFCASSQPLFKPEAVKSIHTPKALSEELTRDKTSDLDKVRAIFNWITNNISYRTRPTVTNSSEPFDFDVFMKKSNDEIIAEKVLLNGSAYCDGYSRLFKTLCDYAGIRSEVISGYARIASAKKFGSNHKWNSVLIDNKWYLLDATWASGYINGNDFVKRYDDSYFLSSPQQFINDHYPEDAKWTLLKDTPTIKEFNSSPFRYTEYYHTKINSYFPVKGIIEAKLDDTIRFNMDVVDIKKRFYISSSAEIDSSLLEQELAGSPFDRTVNPFRHNISTNYIADCPDVQWLYLIYDNEVILKYRLKISK